MISIGGPFLVLVILQAGNGTPAAQVSSSLAPAPTSDHPSLELAGFLQVQYLVRETQDHLARRLASGVGPVPNVVDGPSAPTPPFDECTLLLRHARLSAAGIVGSPRLGYFAEVDFGQGRVLPLEYRMHLAVGRHLTFNAGQMRVPFSHSWLRREERLSFPERDIATEQFRYDYDVGVSVEGAWLADRLHVIAGAFNGGGAALGRNDNLDPILVLRVSGTPVGASEHPERVSIAVGGGVTADYVPVPAAFGYLGGAMPPTPLVADSDGDGLADGVRVLQGAIDLTVLRGGLRLDAEGYVRREDWRDIGRRQPSPELVFSPRATYWGFYAEAAQIFLHNRMRAGARFALTELSPLMMGGRAYDAHSCLSPNNTIYQCALPYSDARTEISALIAGQPFVQPLWLSVMYSRLYWRSIGGELPPSPGEHRAVVTAQIGF